MKDVHYVPGGGMPCRLAFVTEIHVDGADLLIYPEWGGVPPDAIEVFGARHDPRGAEMTWHVEAECGQGR